MQLLTAQFAQAGEGLVPVGLEATAAAREIRRPIWVERDSFAEMPGQGSSRFPARGVSHALLDAVRDVALLASGGDVDAARLVSKGEWNDAREPAGFGDLPVAESIRQRLRMTHWRSVLAVVFLPAEQRRQGIGTYTKRVGAFGPGAELPELIASPVERERIEALLAEDDVANSVEAALSDEGAHRPRELVKGPESVIVMITARALKTVAYRLGHTPAAREYDHEVTVLEDGRRRAGLPPLGFPTSDSVILRFGSWTKACEACGLAPPVAYRQASGVPLVEMIDASIDFWGVVVDMKTVARFAAARDISAQYRPDHWDGVLDEVRELRAARGATMPTRASRGEAKYLPMPTVEQAAEIRARRFPDAPLHRRPRLTAEDVYEGLRIYKAEHLGPNDRPVTTHYMASCRTDSRLVWPSKFKRLTGKTFTQLMTELGV